MTLEIHSKFYRHPEGKEYFLAIIRDSANSAGPSYLVKNFGKAVNTEFDMGQVQALLCTDYWAGSAAYGKEHNHRLSASKGYELIFEESWRPLTPHQEVQLEARSSFNAAQIRISVSANTGMQTVKNPDGTKTVTYSNGASITYDANGNAVPDPNAQPSKPAPDPNAVPGPRTGGPKRLEWVMSHPDHPEALQQMMQVAQQMTADRDKAATLVASLDNDLSFVEAWLQQRLAAMVR